MKLKHLDFQDGGYSNSSNLSEIDEKEKRKISSKNEVDNKTLQ